MLGRLEDALRGWLPRVLGLAAAGTLAAQGFRERVDVELVRVDLVASDSQGKPIQGLSPAELTVRIDGRAVRLEGFEVTPANEGSTAAAKPTPALPTAAAGEKSAPAPPPDEGASAARPGRPRYSMAFLADETSSEQSNRQAVYGQIFDFAKSGLPPDVEVLLARFNGLLTVECPWTSDAEHVRRGVAALARRRAAPVLGAPGQIAGDAEIAPFTLQLDAMEAVAHTRTSLAGVFDALRLFPDQPGRKALFVITDGAPFLAPAEISKDLIGTAASNDTGGLQVSRAGREAEYDRDLLSDGLAWSRSRSASLLVDIARLALVRGIEIHPVRAVAHDFGARVSADRGTRARPVDPRRSFRAGESLPTTDIAAGQAMEAVAEQTGGEAVLSRRFFEDEVRKEVSLRDAAYLVSFRDPFAGDHRFHRIEISSTRPGVRLRYRRGYRILDVRESLVERAINRLYLAADENPLGVRLQFRSAGLEGGRAIAEITVAYPAPPQAGGRSARAAAATDAGTVEVIGFCAVRHGALSEPIDLSGPAEAISPDGGTWLARSGRVRVKPGAYRWSFAVRDQQTGITSYLTFDRALP